MNDTYYEQAILIDTSAIIALEDPQDQFHQQAKAFLEATETEPVLLAALNATAQETYTTVRRQLGFEVAVQRYDFLVGDTIIKLRFASDDERAARDELERFREHELSFHDALMAVVMKRLGIYRVFAFDHHFGYFGFEILPGSTR